MSNSNLTIRSMMRAGVAAALLALACTAVASAQIGPAVVSRSVIASGGTHRSANATTLISGTIGQTSIGVASDDAQVLYQGFWEPLFSISSAPDDRVTAGGGAFHLANSPNPFSGSTSISFNLATRGHVDLRVYDMAGDEVIRLAGETRDAGEHTVIWDGTTASGERAPVGMYTCLLTVSGPDGVNTATVRRDRVKLMLMR